MFQGKVVEKIKIHILCSVTFFSENRAVYEIMSQTIWRIGVAYWINKPKRAKAQAPPPLYTHPNTRAHLRIRMPSSKRGRATHTHTHTHEYIIFIAFRRRQRLRERASILRYAYIGCLVL